MKYILSVIYLLGGISALILCGIALKNHNAELAVAWGTAGFALFGDFGFTIDDD